MVYIDFKNAILLEAFMPSNRLFNKKFNWTFSSKSHDILFGIVINTAYSKHCNIDEFVIKAQQKVIIESTIQYNTIY